LRCRLRKIDRPKLSGRRAYIKLDANTLFRKEQLQAFLTNAQPVKITSDSARIPASAIRSTRRRAA